MKTKYIVGVIVLLVGLYWWFNRKPEQQTITPGGPVSNTPAPITDSEGNVWQPAQLSPLPGGIGSNLTLIQL